jgi:hypothetical protein
MIEELLMMQSTRDDMSGNWNGDIFDMDEEKKNGQLNFSLRHELKRTSFCSSLMMILFIVRLLMKKETDL